MAEPELLKPLGKWEVVNRGRFETEHDAHRWTVDVDFFDFGEKVRLYRDGVLVATEKSPATFDAGPGARIEASMGIFGMRQIDLVVGADTVQMTPVEGTAEGWRLGLERERPELSRAIGAVSWAVLVLAALVGLGELLGLIGIDWPLELPPAPATVLGFAALAAAVERALRFKSNRWLD